MPIVKTLLTDPNPYIQARAIWLLAQLGQEGQDAVADLLAAPEPNHRTTQPN